MQAQSELVTSRITVDYVNMPKPGKKQGSVKTSDGIYFNVWPKQMGIFEPGGVYDVEYTETEGQHTTFRDIKNARPAAAPRTNGQSQLPLRESTRIDVQQSAPRPARNGATLMAGNDEPLRQAPVERPAPQAPANGYYRPTAPVDAERMFVCATLGHFIETGRIGCDADELIERVNTLRQVWQATFGADR